MLLLKRHLVELVRAGKKNQTIRLWSRPLLRPGQISYTPGLGKMLITSVDQLAGLEELTEADALADGFADLKSLMAEIHRIYGASIPKNRNVFRIRFQWPCDEKAAAPTARSTGFSLKKKLQPKHEVTPPRKTRRTTKTPKETEPSPPLPRRTTPAMTRRQREALRAFVITKAPPR